MNSKPESGDLGAVPLKGRIAQSALWIIGSRGALQVVSFANTLLVARLLSSADYGLMALTTLWIELALVAADPGISYAVVQFRDAEHGELNSLFYICVGAALSAYLGLFALGPLLAGWFVAPQLSLVLRVTGSKTLLYAVGVVPEALLRQRFRFDRVSQAGMLAALASMLVVLLLAWTGAGVWALVAGTLMASLVQSIVILSWADWRPSLRVRWSKRFREMLQFSAGMLMARVCRILHEESDALILGKAAGPSVLGFYSIAKVLTTLVVEKVSIVIMQLAGPLMAELQNEPKAMGSLLIRTLRLVMWVTLPSTVGLFVGAEECVRVALTDKWLPLVPLIRWLSFYAIVHSFAVLFYPVLIARYRTRFLACYFAMLLGITSVGFWIGAATWGAVGVAATLSLVYPALAFTMIREAIQELHVRWREVWIVSARALGAALLVLATMGAFKWWHGSSAEWSLRSRFLMLLLAGSIGYAIALITFGRVVLLEASDIIRQTLRRRPQVSPIA